MYKFVERNEKTYIPNKTHIDYGKTNKRNACTEG